MVGHTIVELPTQRGASLWFTDSFAVRFLLLTTALYSQGRCIRRKQPSMVAAKVHFFVRAVLEMMVGIESSTNEDHFSREEVDVVIALSNWNGNETAGTAGGVILFADEV